MKVGKFFHEEITKRFDEKVAQLKRDLPKASEMLSVNCAALTLTSVLEVIGVESHFFYNLAVPLAGGFGGFRSMYDWKGPCGAVCGGCAAIGIILGGHDKMKPKDIPNAYLRASRYAHSFEKEFGSVSCSHLCGIDFSDAEGFQKYLDNNVWEKTCYKFVVFAVDQIRKIMSKELKKKWG